MVQSILYLLSGLFFGIVLVKAQVISWFRIQEMFYLESFHLYGVIGSAIVTGLLSYQLLRRLGIKSADGKPIQVDRKPFHPGVIIGGTLFGIGWAITGACPGPLYALLGSGYAAAAVMIVSAMLGVWVYGLIRDRLWH
ncbi:MAG: YeeE/YedE family protein [Bacteroidetes bacterium]|jgi:uncharacterized membrane protein YedE/YeeE|nr:YeeE/YedE family protein [Bacteroidota bacterium]